MSRGDAALERRMALHDLIDRILVSRDDHPDAYRRIHFHEPYLRHWLFQRPQWRLLTGPGVYRLERLPSQALAGRGLPRFRSPLDYACLCWVLWFAEARAASTQDWFVLSELAAEIMGVASGLFSLAERGHRESLVRALQLLVDLGVLIYRDGDAEGWASGQAAAGEPADVLYDFAEGAPRLLANFDEESLDQLAGAAAGQRTLPLTGEAAEPLARAWRSLLLGPVFWQGDDPEAFAALVAGAEQVRTDLEQALGWELELSPDYGRIWRTTTARQAGGILLDLVPEPGENGPERHVRYIYHPILLLLGSIRRQLAAGRLTCDGDGAVAITGGALGDMLGDLYRSYRQNWGAELGSQIGLPELTGRLLQEMRLMGYLRGPDHVDRCWLLPAAALASGEYVAGQETGSAGPRPAQAPGQQLRLWDGQEEGGSP